MNLKGLNKICTVLNTHLQILVQPIYNGRDKNFFFIDEFTGKKRKDKLIALSHTYFQLKI